MGEPDEADPDVSDGRRIGCAVGDFAQVSTFCPSRLVFQDEKGLTPTRWIPLEYDCPRARERLTNAGSTPPL